jgi:hypothetical protein
MSEEKKSMDVSEESRQAGYEKEDANPIKIIGFAILTVVLMAAMVLGVMEIFIMTKEQQYQESVLKPESAPLRELRAQEEQILNSYKLLDSSKQIYQIPVSRAMELMADEAFKTRIGQSVDRSVGARK